MRAGRRVGGLAALAVTLIAAVSACGGVEPLALPQPEERSTPPAATPEPATPQGTVSVAYPDVPAEWHGARGDDLAATDLAALWGLPLYRYGPDGVLRPGLVEQFTIDGSQGAWAVEFTLREGEWSDGTPVTADDVVATVEVLRAGPREAEFAVIQAARAVDDRIVRMEFEAPYPRWPHLLSAAPGVLPAHVLAEVGLDPYVDAVPVSGGWFRLEQFDPGRSARFVAHDTGPLGAPHLEAVEIAFTPSYETALGLLDRDRVDAVAGHLALNPVGRAERLEGVEAAAPLGGTMVVLEWDRDIDPAVRRSISSVIDVSQLVEGLLGDSGEVATSPIPGVDGPWPAEGRSSPEQRQIGTLKVLLPRWHEVTGFTSRALQRDASVLEGSFEIVSLETPDFVTSAREEADLVLRIRRTGPRPPLAALAEEVTPELRAADAATVPGARRAQPGLEQLFEEALFRPLYRAGVAHAWDPELDRIRPSAWPGILFWNAGEWRLAEP